MLPGAAGEPFGVSAGSLRRLLSSLGAVELLLRLLHRLLLEPGSLGLVLGSLVRALLQLGLRLGINAGLLGNAVGLGLGLDAGPFDLAVTLHLVEACVGCGCSGFALLLGGRVLARQRCRGLLGLGCATASVVLDSFSAAASACCS